MTPGTERDPARVYRSCMRVLLLLSFLLLSATAHAEERWLLYGTSGGGGRLVRGGAGGTVGHAGVRYRLSRAWWIDAQVGEGFFTPPQEVMGRFGVGARVEATRLAVRPSFYAGFSHGHETTVDHAKHDPAESLFAVSPDLRHRTGLEAGVGITSPPFRVVNGARWSVVLLARGSATYFGDALDTPLYLLGDVGLGVSF